MMRAPRSVPLLLAVCWLAGCKAVGPDFVAPREPVPDAYAAAGPTTPGSTTPGRATPGRATPSPPQRGQAEDAFWWREFHDPDLDRLEAQATAGNLDLKAAYLRIVESRIQVQESRAQGLPSLNASAKYTREQLGIGGIVKSEGLGAGGSAGTQSLISAIEKPVNIWQLGFDARWELDLFGKVRRSVEAATAQNEQAIESRDDLMVTLQAEVAQTYLQLRAAQVLQGIARELIANQRDVLDLTKDRQVHGLVGEVDVESAHAQLANLEAQLPPYDQTVATSRHALAVLTGQTPEALDSAFGQTGALPAPPNDIDVGVPAALARRRPDIRSSEAALHAATAQIGVSVAGLFPDISLTGTYGLRNTGTRYLFDWGSRFYSAAPGISLPIFHGGALLANVRLARAEAAEAALNYRKTVLSALQEVEDGLTGLNDDAARSASLAETVAADQRALDIDLDAFRRGLVSYITVLTMQIQTVQARQQLAQAMLTQSTDVVKLYKALGGGWENNPNVADPTAAEQPAATQQPAAAEQPAATQQPAAPASAAAAPHRAAAWPPTGAPAPVD
jgi:NodT family efflux transporter outer membrane factor (OMF) lipoprotein